MTTERADSTPVRPTRPLTYSAPIRGYGVGMWAWLLQRFSGVLLAVVVFAHVWARLLFPTWGTFQKITDVAMILLVSYHAFSGLRTVMVDLGLGHRAQRAIFWVTVVLALVSAVVALGAYQVRFF